MAVDVPMPGPVMTTTTGMKRKRTEPDGGVPATKRVREDEGEEDDDDVETDSEVGDQEEERPQRVKRFTWKTYAQTLRDVQLPKAWDRSQEYQGDDEDEDESNSQTQFYLALSLSRQLCLTPAFVLFANTVDREGWAASLALEVVNAGEIATEIITALESEDEDSIRTLLGLIPPLLSDLRDTLIPYHNNILESILSIIQRKKVESSTATASLVALEALWKTLLVPSTSLSSVDVYVDAVHPVLNNPKVPREVRKALAGAWGTVVVRRVKNKEQLVNAMVADDDDAVAWSLCAACRNINHTLHSSTSTLLTPVLALPDHMRLKTRVLTSLIHHVPSAAAFEPIASLVLSSSSSSVLLHVLLTTRGGSRLTESLLPTSDIVHTVSTLVALLPLLSLPQVYKLLDSTCKSSPHTVIRALGVLADWKGRAWGGWGSILPLILRIKNDDSNLCHLLHVLHRKGLLMKGKVDLEKIVLRALKKDDARRDALALSVYASDDSLIPVLFQMLGESEKLDAEVLGAILTRLSTTTKKVDIDIRQWSLDALITSPVLVGISKLSSKVELTSEQTLALVQTISSPDYTLRRGALAVLSSPVCKRLLEADEPPLDVSGVRERILRIGKVGGTVDASDSQEREIVVRWFISQMKTPLKPLWEPAARALGAFSAAHDIGKTVWDLFWTEVQNAMLAPTPNKKTGDEDEQEEAKDDEREWGDPTARIVRGLVKRWEKDPLLPLPSISTFSSRLSPTRPDQLLTTIIVSPELVSIAERYGAENLWGLVEASYAEDHKVERKSSQDIADSTINDEEEDAGDEETRHSLPRPILLALLTLLKNFSFKKHHKSPTRRRELLNGLLALPDPAVQKVVLDLVLSKGKASDIVRGVLESTDGMSAVADLDILDGESRDAFVYVLYGMITTRGRGGDKDKGKKKALVRILGGISFESGSAETFDTFLALMMPSSFTTTPTTKKQMGFLHMVRLLVGVWGMKVLGPRLVEGVLACSEDKAMTNLVLKTVVDLFRLNGEFDWTPWISRVVHKLILARVASSSEAGKRPTPFPLPALVLTLLHTWSSHPVYVSYITNSSNLWCIIVDQVRTKAGEVLDIVSNVLEYDQSALECLPQLVVNLQELVASDIEEKRLERVIGVLEKIGIDMGGDAMRGALVGVLVKATKTKGNMKSKVQGRMKEGVLVRILGVLATLPASNTSETEEQDTNILLSPLLSMSTLHQPKSRITLASVFTGVVGKVVQDLNSWKKGTMRMGMEVDWESRMAGFESVRNDLGLQVHPAIIHTALYLLGKDPDAEGGEGEVGMRGCAGEAMREYLRSQADISLWTTIIFPFFTRLLRNKKDERVRREVLILLKDTIALSVNIPVLEKTVGDMQILLPLPPKPGADDGEGDDFFEDIIHLQTRRRVRGVRALNSALISSSERTPLTQQTLTQIILPLLSHYLTPETDHTLRNEVIGAIKTMAASFGWRAWERGVRNAIGGAKRRENDEDENGALRQKRRISIRVLCAYLEGFKYGKGKVAEEKTVRIVQDLVRFFEGGEFRGMAKGEETDEVVGRVPVAVGIIGVLVEMTKSRKDDEAPLDIEPVLFTILTRLAQLFRLKSVDARNAAVDALARIVLVLPKVAVGRWMEVVFGRVKDVVLRIGMKKDFEREREGQRVLVHVVAAVIDKVTESYTDMIIPERTAAVVVDVCCIAIFSSSPSPEEKKKMPSGKALELITTLSRRVSGPGLNEILTALRAIIAEGSGVGDAVEETLKKVAIGVVGGVMNEDEILGVCWEVLSESAAFMREETDSGKAKNKMKVKKDVRVIKSRKEAEKEECAGEGRRRERLKKGVWRFMAFALSLLHTYLKRHSSTSYSPSILSRLKTLVTPVGNTLYSTQASILVSSLRCLSLLLQLPLFPTDSAKDKTLTTVLNQSLTITRELSLNSGWTGYGVSNDEEGNSLGDVALRSIAAILPLCPPLNQFDSLFLITLVKDTLDDPSASTERIHSAFILLRAITHSSSTEEVIPSLRRLLLSSHDNRIRELARNAFSTFILDTPMGRKRVRKEMEYVLANSAGYEYAEGRESALEVLGNTVRKVRGDMLAEWAGGVFASMVAVLGGAGGESEKKKARLVVELLVRRLVDEEELKRLLVEVVVTPLMTWLKQLPNVELRKVACMVWAVVIPLLKDFDSRELVATLEALLRECSATEVEVDSVDGLNWQLPYHALKVLYQIPVPSSTDTLMSLLLYPHSWVRLMAARVLVKGLDTNPETPPLLALAKTFLTMLRSPHLDEELSRVIGKGLVWIGRKEISTDLFALLSASTRAGIIEQNGKTKANATLWVLSGLRVMAALVSFGGLKEGEVIEEERLRRALKPLWYILNDDDNKSDELNETASSFLTLVQQHAGTDAFARIYREIGDGAMEKRKDRKDKRVRLGVMFPEVDERRKGKKRERGKESKKEKGFGKAKKMRVQ